MLGIIMGVAAASVGSMAFGIRGNAQSISDNANDTLNELREVYRDAGIEFRDAGRKANDVLAELSAAIALSQEQIERIGSRTEILLTKTCSFIEILGNEISELQVEALQLTKNLNMLIGISQSFIKKADSVTQKADDFMKMANIFMGGAGALFLVAGIYMMNKIDTYLGLVFVAMGLMGISVQLQPDVFIGSILNNLIRHLKVNYENILLISDKQILQERYITCLQSLLVNLQEQNLRALKNSDEMIILNQSSRARYSLQENSMHLLLCENLETTLQQKLLRACKEGDLNSVILLHNKGASLTETTEGMFPLKAALSNLSLDVAIYIDRNVRESNKTTLNNQWALLHGNDLNPSIVELSEFDLDKTHTSSDASVAHLAAWFKKLDSVCKQFPGIKRYYSGFKNTYPILDSTLMSQTAKIWPHHQHGVVACDHIAHERRLLADSFAEILKEKIEQIKNFIEIRGQSTQYNYSL